MVNMKPKATIGKPKSARALMRQPVQAGRLHGEDRGHFYVNPASIDVYAINAKAGVVAGTRITRAQLEKALALMDLV